MAPSPCSNREKVREVVAHRVSNSVYRLQRMSAGYIIDLIFETGARSLAEIDLLDGTVELDDACLGFGGELCLKMNNTRAEIRWRREIPKGVGRKRGQKNRSRMTHGNTVQESTIMNRSKQAVSIPA